MNQVYKTLRTTRTALVALVAGLFLLAAQAGYAQTVTISTDKDDYSPGEYVIITGSGWPASDMVELTLTHIEPNLPDHEHDSWKVLTDENGNIYEEWYVEEIEINTTFLLRAQSLSNPDLVAETTFTDSQIYSITITTTPPNSFLITGNGFGSGVGVSPYKIYFGSYGPYDLNWNGTDQFTGTIPNIPLGNYKIQIVNNQGTVLDKNSEIYFTIGSGPGGTCTTPPVALCKNAEISLDENGFASLTVADLNDGSTAACGFSSIAVSANSFSCDELGENTVTLTVTDINNAVSTCTASVNVVDELAPDAKCKKATIYLDKDGTATLTAADIDGGSTDNCGITFRAVGEGTFSCSDLGDNYIELYVTDESENDDYCTAVVTVVDNLLPTFTAPKEVTIYRDADCKYDASKAVTGDVTDEADNCTAGEATYQDAIDATDPCKLVIKRAWNLVDDSENAALPQVQIITVLDNTPPTFTAPGDITIYKDAKCLYDASVARTGDVINEADNCDVGEAKYTDEVDDTNPCKIIITRIWKLIDKCGNGAENQIQIITVEDNTAPDLTKGTIDLCYSTKEAAEEAAVAATTMSDNCTAVNDLVIEVTTKGDCSAEIIVSVTDECGNMSSVNYNTKIDNTAPVITKGTIGKCYPTAEAAEAAAKLATTATDNCSSVIVEAASTAGTCIAVVTVTETDECGNTSSVTYNTRIDNEAPVITKGTILSCYPTVEAAENAAKLATTATDNCSSVIVEAASAVGTCSAVVTVTETDECGNTSSVIYETRIDNTPPVIASPIVCNSTKTVSTDAGECTYKAGNDWDATAKDNCEGVVTITNNLTGNSSLNGYPFKFGKTVVIWTAVDECGNSSTCSYTVDVNKVTTITKVSVNVATADYSDQVTLTATVTPWDCTPCKAAGKVEFWIGPQSMGTAVLNNGVATLTTQLCGNFAGLGPKDLKATFTPDLDICSAYLGSTGICESCLNITCEDNVEITYTGQLIVPVLTGATSAKLVLSAFIEEKDGTTCGFPNSVLVFQLNGTKYEAPIGLINPGNKSQGAATVSVTVPKPADGEIYDLLIYFKDGSNYCASPVAENITVYTPQNEFITGGGYLLLNNPGGLWAGKPGTKNNFGFNVKYNKTGKTLKGNVNIIYRREVDGVLRTYQVKANAMTSLSVDPSKLPTSATATFYSKANIQDITELPVGPAYPVDGNATLCIQITDLGEPGINKDKIAITVWNKSGGIFFTSNWLGGPTTVEQAIAGGNLVVHPGSLLKSGQVEAVEITTAIVPDLQMSEGLKIYPNPFSDRLRFEFVAPESVYAKIEVFDMTGRKVETVFEQPVIGGVQYSAEFKPGKVVSAMYFYRMTLGETVTNGKAVYKK